MNKVITVMQIERVKSGLTMQELADKAGVNRKTVWSSEHLVNYPNHKTRLAIKEALGYEGNEHNLFRIL